MRRNHSLKARHLAASAKTAWALSLFARAADELEAAALDHDDVAAAAEAIADEHTLLHVAATADAIKSREHAKRLREFAGETSR